MIATINEDAFCGIKNVHELQMVNCGITLAPNVTPLQLSLKVLILNNNLIRSFPADYFDGLILEHLQVDNNLLTSVPPINRLAHSLVVLSLTRNSISTVDGLWTNTTYHRLHSVHLSWNMISSVKVDISAPMLEGLHLRNNSIISMDDPKSPSLFVHLRENPLHCNITMAWAAQTGMSDPETSCASPSCAAGRVLSDLGTVIYTVKTSIISRTLVGNKFVDRSDVVGASPVGAVLTTSGFRWLGRDNYKMIRETVKFWDLVRLILEVWR